MRLDYDVIKCYKISWTFNVSFNSNALLSRRMSKERVEGGKINKRVTVNGVIFLT